MRGGVARSDFRFNLYELLLQLIQRRAHCSQLRPEICFIRSSRRSAGATNAPCDPLRYFSRLVSTHKRSIRSTTPTIAESIAAPASPVAAVDALQPSCTISTVSPTPASTESSASVE